MGPSNRSAAPLVSASKLDLFGASSGGTLSVRAASLYRYER